MILFLRILNLQSHEQTFHTLLVLRTATTYCTHHITLVCGPEDLGVKPHRILQRTGGTTRGMP